jgi:hypothetical protein
MIRSQLVFAAENVVRDALSNKVSAFNILDEIVAQKFPLLLVRMAAVLVSRRDNDDPEEHELELRVSLDGEHLHSFPMPISYQGQLTHRALMVFEGFVIPHAGELAFSFRIGEQDLASYHFFAKLQDSIDPIATQK